MAPTVAVIGAGSIGRRHLEALSRLDGSYGLMVVEPSAPARQEVSTLLAGRPDTIVASSSGALSTEIDVAIVATTAGPRLAAMTDLLEHASVRFLILEKFLFQSQREYDEAGLLLREHEVPTWVNCPRRVWPSYSSSRDAFGGEDSISCRVVTSPRAGLGSNAIHFLDLLSMLTGTTEFQLDGGLLKYMPDGYHREGHGEFVGTLYGSAPRSTTFEYTSHTRGTAPLLVEVSSPSRRMLVREFEEKAWVASDEGGWVWDEVDFPVVLQSRLTDLVVRDLLETGSCGLPPYSDSASLHRSLLAVLLDRFRVFTGSTDDRCPIT